MKIYATARSENDRRQHERLYHHSAIQLVTASNESISAYTLNLSDGGLLINCSNDNLVPKIGEVIELHSVDFPDAPIKKVIVRRIDETNHIGVQFI